MSCLFYFWHVVTREDGQDSNGQSSEHGLYEFSQQETGGSSHRLRPHFLRAGFYIIERRIFSLAGHWSASLSTYGQGHRIGWVLDGRVADSNSIIEERRASGRGSSNLYLD